MKIDDVEEQIVNIFFNRSGILDKIFLKNNNKVF